MSLGSQRGPEIVWWLEWEILRWLVIRKYSSVLIGWFGGLHYWLLGICLLVGDIEDMEWEIRFQDFLLASGPGDLLIWDRGHIFCNLVQCWVLRRYLRHGAII